MKLNRNRKKGQTALEYALVIGVLAVGIVGAARFIFQGENSPASNLFNKSVANATGLVDGAGDAANGNGVK